MKNFSLFLLLFATLSFAGCGFAEREQQLREKETMLAQKEQQLVMKEKELTLKEQDLLQREQLLDSSKRTWDSIGIYEEALIGDWNVKMSCTETSCEGSAIGDTKIEQWAIRYENNYVVAEAFSKKKLLRIYKGTYTGQVLSLKEDENATGTEIIVELTFDAKDPNHMKGTRIIVQPACKIHYNLEVERAGKPGRNITNILN